MIDTISGIIGVISAVAAVRSKNIMHSIVALAVFMLCVASLFFHIGATFLAIGQMIIFAGGFVSLLLLNFADDTTNIQKKSDVFKLALAGIFIALALMIVPLSGASGLIETFEIASVMFSEYYVILMIVFLILLSAVVSSMYILRRER